MKPRIAIWLAILLLQPVWFLCFGPLPGFGVIPSLVIAGLPLGIGLVLLIRARTGQASVVAGLLLLPYLLLAVSEGWADASVSLPAMLQAALIIGYFTVELRDALARRRRTRGG
ncbi:MAG: hypothetical protein Kow0020_05060 [Wenzhouxiangellaceae bacterium]